MLPDPTLEPFWFGPFLLHWFGLLVGTGLIFCYFVLEKRLKDWGLRYDLTLGLVASCFTGGAFGGHWFDLFFYHPERLVEQGWFALINIPDGLASLGSFVGGIGGGSLYLTIKRQPIWPYFDACVVATAPAWMFGRLGCTVAFDHPGPLTDFVLGMMYTGIEVSHGVRHNLGFYEAVFTFGLCVLFAWHWKRPHFLGWYTAMFGMTYMPVRFAMDFLRANDRFYLGLTPGQYMCILGFVASAWLYRTRRHSPHLMISDGRPHRLPGGQTVPGVEDLWRSHPPTSLA